LSSEGAAVSVDFIVYDHAISARQRKRTRPKNAQVSQSGSVLHMAKHFSPAVMPKIGLAMPIPNGGNTQNKVAIWQPIQQ
jgi:hypothetical protein